MKYISRIAIVFFVLSLYACQDNAKEHAQLQVRLVDAPASYDEVNIEVLGVSINYGDESNDNTWQELDSETGIYNVLELTAGNDALLVSNEIPSGTISQIRLLLGENNTVVENGNIFPLKTPSGQSSGVKIDLNQSFEGGMDYTIILDFDAAKSIVDNPQKFILKPVIRASMEALNGAIEGTISPAGVDATIYAMQNDEIVASTVPDVSGKFMLRGMSAGTYILSIDVNDSEIIEDKEITDVEVTIGNVTNVGEISVEIN